MVNDHGLQRDLRGRLPGLAERPLILGPELVLAARVLHVRQHAVVTQQGTPVNYSSRFKVPIARWGRGSTSPSVNGATTQPPWPGSRVHSLGYIASRRPRSVRAVARLQPRPRDLEIDPLPTTPKATTGLKLTRFRGSSALSVIM